jgi:hypothetical protein
MPAPSPPQANISRDSYLPSASVPVSHKGTVEGEIDFFLLPTILNNFFCFQTHKTITTPSPPKVNMSRDNYNDKKEEKNPHI